jgi:hypothetical protein
LLSLESLAAGQSFGVNNVKQGEYFKAKSHKTKNAVKPVYNDYYSGKEEQ